MCHRRANSYSTGTGGQKEGCRYRVVVSQISKPHTPSHRHRRDQTPEGPNALTTRSRHTQAQASKQPTSRHAVTDTTTRPSRPTAAHLGVHGSGGGPIDLEAHEIHQLCHLWHVLGPLMHPVRLSGAEPRMAARGTPMKGMRLRRWRAISRAITTERERRRRVMKKARASVMDRAPMRRQRRSARPSAVMARSSCTSGEHSPYGVEHSAYQASNRARGLWRARSREP